MQKKLFHIEGQKIELQEADDGQLLWERYGPAPAPRREIKRRRDGGKGVGACKMELDDCIHFQTDKERRNMFSVPSSVSRFGSRLGKRFIPSVMLQPGMNGRLFCSAKRSGSVSDGVHRRTRPSMGPAFSASSFLLLYSLTPFSTSVPSATAAALQRLLPHKIPGCQRNIFKRFNLFCN